jgi:hypothetical protein
MKKDFFAPELKSFLKPFLAFVLIMICTDWLVGDAMKYLYDKQRSGRMYRTSYALNTTRADILVIGSSRANHHYNTQILENNLKATVYNCGRDKMGGVYSCAVAAGAIARYTPKLIILDIRPSEFTLSEKDMLAPLLPYNKNQAIQPYIYYNDPYERVKLLSHIYPYNSLLGSLLAANISADNGDNYNGYIPLTGILKKVKLTDYYEQGIVDTEKVKFYEHLLAQLNARRIPTLVILSPFYYKYHDGSTVAIAKSLCAPYKSVRFISFAHDSISSNKTLFMDKPHLNHSGAQIFTKKLIASIRDIIKQ